MRKITTKTEQQKKARKNQLIIGIILISVMLFSVIGYSFGSNQDNQSTGTKITYNGFEFLQENGLWYLETGEIRFSFLHSPREAFNINSTLNSITSYSNKPLYIYSENAEAESEIARNLFYEIKIAERMQRACPPGMTCADDLPAKNCADNFIIIKNSNETRIRQEENCVFIEGNSAILTRLADSFLLKILGIQ